MAISNKTSPNQPQKIKDPKVQGAKFVLPELHLESEKQCTMVLSAMQ